MPPGKFEITDTMTTQDTPQPQPNSALESEIDAAGLGCEDADQNDSQALCKVGLGQDDKREVDEAVKVPPRRKQLNIVDLPSEIVLEIFQVIKRHGDDLCYWGIMKVRWQGAAICLGLTCTKFWTILQSYIKIGRVPVAYMRFFFKEASDPWTNLLLDDWFGPRYRYCGLWNKYLNREVYGTGRSAAYSESCERWKDWKMLSGYFRRDTTFYTEIIPNPFGKGWQWNEEMYDLFLGGLKDSFELEGHEDDWKTYWRQASLVKKVRDKRMWEALEEWIQMVGL